MSKIRDLIDEIFFDYHIRGCKLADYESNDICSRRKEQDKKELLFALQQEWIKMLKGMKKECPNHGGKKEKFFGSGVPCSCADNKIYNQAISDMHSKIMGGEK